MIEEENVIKIERKELEGQIKTNQWNQCRNNEVKRKQKRSMAERSEKHGFAKQAFEKVRVQFLILSKRFNNRFNRNMMLDKHEKHWNGYVK